MARLRARITPLLASAALLTWQRPGLAQDAAAAADSVAKTASDKAANDGSKAPESRTPAAVARAAPADTSELPQFPAEVEFLPRGFQEQVAFSLENANLGELVRVISQLTGRRFIFGGKVRDIRATVYAPTKVTVAEAYRAFLSILETNGLTVVPHGQFLKIVETPGITTQATPIFGAAEPVPAEERFITRLLRVSHVSVEDVRALLDKYRGKDATVESYAPSNLLIITDTAANVRRMLRLVEELDVGGAESRIWIQPIRNADATEVASKLTALFDLAGARQPAGAAQSPAGDGDLRIAKILPDERTNAVIIVATEPAYQRVLAVINRIDVRQSSTGEAHVLRLQHASAQDVAQTLNGMMTAAGAGAKAGPTGGGAAGGIGLLEGNVAIMADAGSNALVVTATPRDFASVRSVVEELDLPRRQVFIEAVIMEVSSENGVDLGLGYHQGANLAAAGQSPVLAYGGMNAARSIGAPTQDDLSGLAVGVRGPNLTSAENGLFPGLSIPSFGIFLHALARKQDVNILSTPHLLATDNQKAELSVGSNIPLQTNVGGASSVLGAAAAGEPGAASLLQGLNVGNFAAPRQDVGTKVTLTPHLNDSDQIRLDIAEEISQPMASDGGALGAVSIARNTVTTTAVVRDQQTIVIGGLVREVATTKEDKVPVLGDLPLLGALFRSTRNTTSKSNLLLILTPHIVRTQDDLRRIFERKLQERQEFLDRYFVFSDEARWEPPHDVARLNGLVESIRQAQREVAEAKQRFAETLEAPATEAMPTEPIAWVPTSEAFGAAPPSPGASSPASRAHVRPPPRTVPVGASPP